MSGAPELDRGVLISDMVTSSRVPFDFDVGEMNSEQVLDHLTGISILHFCL